MKAVEYIAVGAHASVYRVPPVYEGHGYLCLSGYRKCKTDGEGSD